MFNGTVENRLRALIPAALMAVLMLLVAACGGGNGNGGGGPITGNGGGNDVGSPQEGGPQIGGIHVCPRRGVGSWQGAGATFPFPLLSSMIDDYSRVCGVRGDYNSIGSGGGMTQVQAWTVDWGASEGIMNEEQLSEANPAGGDVLHIPFTAGALAIIYNLDGIEHATMRMTPDVLADIYLKNITRWNDPRIVELNPELDLPDRGITVVHRSDGSGTTYVYTHYLSRVSPEWEGRVGYATSVSWPGDIGGPGNEGVTNQVRQIPGAIGYVERAYALQNNMPWMLLQNQSGNYVEPTQQAAALAADIPNLPDDMRVMYTDTAHPDGYPISGFAWFLIYENQRNEAMADAVARWAYWALTEEGGQSHHDRLQYVPITGEAQAKALCLISRIRYPNGNPVLPELSCD